MLSGALIKIPDSVDVDSLNGITWERQEEGLDLKSVIQFQERPVTSRRLEIRAGLAIHQYVLRENYLAEESGVYTVSQRDAVETIWSNIHIIPGLVIVDSLENRNFVRETINRGLRLSTDTAHDVYLDTTKIARDHGGQWIRGFAERRGRVERGTVYGEGVEQDAVFGPELDRSSSRSVGWVTRFFGPPAKVRVSPRGSVTVWLWPPVDQFLDFIHREIMPYMVSL